VPPNHAYTSAAD